jgi:4-amino-4-deoxy-L-arabinose transferase-like glycosyltransferase
MSLHPDTPAEGRAGLRPWLLFIVLLLLWSGLFLFRLGYLEVDFNETRRIFPALTMLDHGQWLTPIFDGQIYNRKPPLINWLIAASVWLNGAADEFSARLPVALSLLPLLGLLVFHRGSWIDLRGRFFTALILLTTVGFLAHGRYCEIDLCFAVSAGAAILLWLDNYSRSLSGFGLWWPAALALGIGLLLKGPLVLVVFYVVVLLVLKGDRTLRPVLFSRGHGLGLVLALGIFCAWLLARSLWGGAGDGVLAETAAKAGGTDLSTTVSVWWIELSQRLFPGDQAEKVFNWGKWLRAAAGGPALFLPWLVLVPLFWRLKGIQPQPEPRERAIVFGLRNAVVILALFVMAMPLNKARYLLPVFPAAALVLGWILARNGSGGLAAAWRKVLLGLCWVPALGALLGTLALAVLRLSGWGPAPLAALIDQRQMLLAVAATILFAAAGFCIWRRRSRPVSVSGLMAATVLLIFCLTNLRTVFVFPWERSREVLRPVARSLTADLETTAPIHVYDLGEVEPLRFYLPPHLVRLDPARPPAVDAVKRVLVYGKVDRKGQLTVPLPDPLARFLADPALEPRGRFQDKNEVYWTYGTRQNGRG